jgi:hypothetical protein
MSFIRRRAAASDYANVSKSSGHPTSADLAGNDGFTTMT